MKSKNIISLTIFFCFIIMAISGMMLYFGQKEWHAVETLHILFGVVFLGFAVFHILNNWSSITGYSKNKKESKIRKEFIVVAAVFGIFLIGGALELPPFMAMAHGGKRLFGPNREKGTQVIFNEIKTNQDKDGHELTLFIEKNKEVELPIMAIWVEDSLGNFVNSLFVPKQTVVLDEDNDEPIGKMIAEGEVEFKDFDSKELKTFDAKAAVKTSNYDKFTPIENVVLATKTNLEGSGHLVLEILNAGKTEVYKTAINTKTEDTKKLKSEGNTFLKRAIVEVN